MDSYTITMTDVALENVHDAIRRPLFQYNEAMAGPSGFLPLILSVADQGGEVAGGMWGRTAFGWLYTELLVVPETLRGQGLGREIMHRAHEEARRRGCHSAWLDTFEFQARGFYERIGYQQFAELADYPEGSARFFLKRSLLPGR